MEAYLVCLVAYLFLNQKADSDCYKIIFITILFILTRLFLPEYSTEFVLNFLVITDCVLLLLLFVATKGRVAFTIIALSVIPKIIDILLCNFSNGNAPLEILIFAMNADEYLVIGIILALLAKESSSVVTKFYIDPTKVGYRLFILHSLFGIVLILNF